MSDMEFMKAEEGDLISLLERVDTSEVPKKIMKYLKIVYDLHTTAPYW